MGPRVIYSRPSLGEATLRFGATVSRRFRVHVEAGILVAVLLAWAGRPDPA
jgi:hypothetical protein